VVNQTTARAFRIGQMKNIQVDKFICAIKALSKRGGFGESWWAKRWIAVPESFNIGARLGRGRTYPRSGQVLSIDIEDLHVF
jgi:hypothetical protein